MLSLLALMTLGVAQESPPKAESGLITEASTFVDRGLWGAAEAKLRNLKGPVGRGAWALLVATENEEYRERGVKEFFPDKAVAIAKEVRPQLERLHADDPEAASVLAGFYGKGLGVEADPETAFSLTKRAAESGRARSMAKLAICYRKGQGVKADPKAAFRWAKKSADAGSLSGMMLLGDLHENGVGTPKDRIKAINLYRRSADEGSLDAMWCCFRIAGERASSAVEKNDVRAASGAFKDARSWMKKAANLGDIRAEKVLADFDFNGAIVDDIALLPGQAKATRRVPAPRPAMPPAELLVLGQSEQQSASGNYLAVTIEVKNVSGSALSFVLGKVIFRDAAGSVVTTENITIGDMENGMSRVGETSVRTDPRIVRYDLEFTTGLNKVVRHAYANGVRGARR